MVSQRVLALTLFLVAASSTGATRSATEANPIRKIVTLMQDMQKEITDEGEKEKELYDAYMCYCTKTGEELKTAIETSKNKIDEVSAKLEEDSSSKTAIDQELAGHKKDRADAQSELDKSAGIRAKEAADFADAEADAKNNIEAMASAIPALEKGMGGAALMQMPGGERLKKIMATANGVSAFDRGNVVAFLEGRANGDYVPQSGQIVGILKSMNDDMQANLASIVEEEKSAAAAYSDLKAAKTKEVEVASAAIMSKLGQSGELAVAIVQSKDALADSEAEAQEQNKASNALKVSCEEQQKAWTARQAARAEEVSAISEAIDILNDDDALDIFKKAVPASLVQVPGVSRMGFLQSKQGQGSKLARAHALVQYVAQKYKTVPLELLSYTMGSKAKMTQRAALKGTETEQTFDVLGGLIDGMVKHLQAEGENDAKQKAYCEGEFEKSAEDVKGAQDSLATKTSAISEIKDQVATLKDEVAGLGQEITALDGSVAVASLQRKKENAEYTESMTLNEAAVQLLEKAKQRLQKFYNPVLYKEPAKKELTMEEKIYASQGRGEWNAGPPEEAYIAGTQQLQHEWSGFVQVRQHRRFAVAPPPPTITADAYAKKGEKSTGVLSLIDMISNDLKNDMKTAENEEKAAETDYQEMMSTSAKARAQNAKSITDKESAMASLEERLNEVKGDKMLSFEELQKAQELVGTLHQSCDFIMENFDARKEARVNEMESLKNAKSVLAGASFS